MFSVNTGTTDRTMRAVFGAVIIAMVFIGPKTPWGWLGLIPLGTALMGWCPLYTVFGFNTCDVKSGS